MGRLGNLILAILKKRAWYIILVISSSLYVLKYHKEIFDFTEIKMNATNLIFLIWVFLLLFPLVSELEFLGIKIKKEVNKATGEIKNEVDDIKRTISIIQQNNSVYNNISFANDPLPTKAEMNDSKANRDQGSDYDRIEENMFADVDKKSVILFEARIKLESSMRKITEKVGLPDRQPIRSMLDSLIRYEIIDYETANRISKVNSIANRGVHGEIVSDEYIEYVLDTVPILIKKLQEIDSTLHLIACPRCKYNGYSNHNNTCPKCGYVFIDD